MKKLGLLFVMLGVFSLPVAAQIEQGQHLVGGRLGLGFQLENSGISYPNDNRLDWGSLGAEYGVSYYYLLTPRVGIGADVSYGDFGGGTLFEPADDAYDKTQLFQAMLSARFTANPSHAFRWYIPVGAGLTTARQHIHINRHGVDYSKTATDTSFGWFVGAGFEFDLGRASGWSMGVEGRYNAFSFDTDKLTRNAPPAVYGDGNRRLSYLSFQLRVNKRF